MAEHDIERDTTAASERTSLLAPDNSPSPSPTPGVQNTDHEPRTPKSVAAVISLLLIGVFISQADGTLVMTTYTTISSEFNSFSSAAWLTNSYTLASCAFQPIIGKLSDIYGRKGMLITSYAIFAVGSVATGLGQSMWQLILARIVCAIGSTGIVLIVSIIITDLVPLIQVAAWRSYVNVVATMGRGMGGPLGGLLVDTVGWRWSFISQGPVVLLTILLVAFRLPSSSSTNQHPINGQPSRLRRIDFVGAFLLAVTIVSFLWTLRLGGQELPWSHPLLWVLLISSVVLAAVFVTYEIKVAVEPIFPPQLLVKRDVATPYAITALQTGAQVAMMFSMPLFFRVTANAPNVATGGHLARAVFGNTFGALMAGFYIQRTGRYKNLTILSTVISSLAYVLLVLRWKGKISLLDSLEILPGGFGTGMAQASTFIAMTSVLLPEEIAIATGGMYLSSGVGMLVGLSVSSSVQLSTLRTILRERLTGDTGGAKIIERVLSDVSKVNGLEEGVRKIVIASYVKSLEYSHMVSLGCSLLALLISFTVREHSLQ